MKLNKNNPWLWLYRYNSGSFTSLPKSICPLFWGGLLGGVFLLLSIPYLIAAYVESLLKNEKLKDTLHYWDNWGIAKMFTSAFIVFIYMVLTIAAHTFLGYADEDPITVWIWLFGPLLLVSLIVAVLFVVGYILAKVWEILKKKKASNQPPSVLKEGIKSIKDKVCPIIEWED